MGTGSHTTLSDISAIPEDDIQPPGALQEDVTDSGIPTTTLNAEEEQPRDCVPVVKPPARLM